MATTELIILLIMNLIAQQLRREAFAIEEAYQKLIKSEQKNCLFNNGSNTMWSLSFKRQIVEEVIAHLENEIAQAKDPANKLTKKVPVRASAATEALKSCLGINIVCRKREDGAYEKYVSERKRDYFSLEVAAFLAVQIVIDSSLSPVSSTTILSEKGQPKRTGVRKTTTHLMGKIGMKVEAEIRYKQIKSNLPSFFRFADEYSSGKKDDETLPSSTSYWEKSMKDLIATKAGKIAGGTQEEDGISDELRQAMVESLTWKPFTRAQRIHIGSWLLRAVLSVTKRHKLFETKHFNVDKTKGEYVVLTDKAEEMREQMLEDTQQFCYETKPMLCEPVDNTKNQYKGYLNPSFWMKCRGRDGFVKMSQEHLDFINMLQKIPYKLNPFIVQLMEHCVSRDIKLGKFKPEWYKAPASVAQRLGLGSIDDYEEQTKLVLNHPDFLKEKRARSREIAKARKRVQDGDPSRALYKMVQECKNDKQFYMPTYWDFRGRVYYRPNYLNPQGADPAKAVLQFARATKVDKYTCHCLRLSISAAAGQDKKSYEERMDWVVQHHKDITNVALMFTDEGDLSRALSFLEGFKSDCWDLAAACEEYYWCCLAPKELRRTATHYRCSFDATAQGAQLVSGFRKSRYGASKVNVLKTDKPNDVYLNLWDALIDEAAHNGSLKPKTLRYMRESGYGRKLAKSGIYMSAQYGSGVERQYEDFVKIHDEISKEYQFSDKELALLKSCFKKSVDKVLSIAAFVDWMRSRASLAYDAGRRSFNIPTMNGNVVLMKYAVKDVKEIKTFHHGSINIDPLTKRFNHQEHTREPDKKEWIKACSANAIHAQDAALLSHAFHDWQFNLSTVHDCIVSAPGACMFILKRRFIDTFIETINWDFWRGIEKANNIDQDDETYACVVGDLDPEEVRDANYLLC